MSEPQPSCRLRIIFASGSRRALIFRRGPSHQTRLIAWDLANDTFEPGQWVSRTSVYPDRSALSPDGEYLLTFLGTFRPPYGTFTVLSRPPFFTALALWPKGDTWGGGGAFVGRREIVLDHRDAVLAPGFAMPSGFIVHPASPDAQARLDRFRRETVTWRLGGDGVEARWEREAGKAMFVGTPRKRGFFTEVHYSLHAQGKELMLPGAQWADLDVAGDVLFSIGGCLYRLSAKHLGDAIDRNDTSAARLLADFSDMRFEPITAPYVTNRVLADPEPYAPRLDRVTREDRRQRKRAIHPAKAKSGGRDR